MNNNFWLIGVGVLAAFFIFNSFRISAQKLPPELENQVQKLVTSKEMIGIDVRTPGELKANPSPGAMSIPVGELSSHIEKLDPKKKYVIFCESGARATGVVAKLKGMGFKEVYNLGSWRNWNQLTKK